MLETLESFKYYNIMINHKCESQKNLKIRQSAGIFFNKNVPHRLSRNGSRLQANGNRKVSYLNLLYKNKKGKDIVRSFVKAKAVVKQRVNICDIYRTYTGLGWDWSQVRGTGSSIRGHKGVGGGIVPFLKIANDVALAVDQLGTRKGSINTFIESWHWDIEDFIDLRKNSGDERRRTHDLFVSLWINDLFMERAGKNQEWTLFDPRETSELNNLFGEQFKEKYLAYEHVNNIRKKKIPARTLYRKIITNYFETGTPFLGFKDEANRRNQNSHSGLIRSSNLCMEIFQNTRPAEYKVINTRNEKVAEGRTAVCNLASINLAKVNSREDIERVVKIAMKVLDNVIDLNYYPIESAKLSNMDLRAVGLGVMGESQMLAERHIHFGTKEHYEFIDEVMENISFYAIKSSIDLAKELGAYPKFEGSNWSKGILPIDTANEKAKSLTDRKYSQDWDSIREDVKKFGIRNGYLMAVAPTSSISILVGTTQAIEPIYKRKWFENNLSGQTPAVAPNLSADTWAFYKSAYEIDQIKLIEAGAVRQKWIDQGQSLNLFVDPKKYNGNDLIKFYLSAWQYGLKSTYYLRSQAPEIVDRADECLVCQ